LALQINESFVKMAAGTSVRVVGGLSEISQLQSIRKGAPVLTATCAGLYDFLSRGLVNRGAANIVVLDEADRMHDMGFLPTIKRIMAAIPTARQTLFFSATIESSVKHLAEMHVRNAIRIELGSITKPVEQVGLPRL
jgi:ATP-dependent RNA helicase RhlE